MAIGVAGNGILCAADAARSAPPPEDPLVAAVAQASTRFAADLYAQLRTQEGNLCFAPLGLAQSLLPIAVGAQGRAGGELAEALHLAVAPREAADGFALLTRRLQRAAGGTARLDFARALWVQQWNTINTDYVELLRQHCRSELRVIDFARGEQAAHWINRWVSDSMGDRITAITDAAAFDSSTRLLVANAVHFEQEWKHPFDPALTVPAPFELPSRTVATETPVPASAGTAAASPPSGDAATEAKSPPEVPGSATPPISTAVEVATMRRIGPMRVATQAGCRLVSLPYQGEAFSVVLLVPDTGVALAEVEAQLSGERLASILDAMARAEMERIELWLPRFTVHCRVPQLAESLRRMGVTTAFDRSGAADFSTLGENLDGSPVYLSNVHHVVKLEVDESGAEAGAVSAPAPEVPYDVPVAAPQAFRVDRPFLYFICDNRTGALLFLGRVVDPRAG